MDETGEIREPPDMQQMRNDLFAVSISDEETRAAIRQAHEAHGVMLEPHGAVGWAGLGRFLATQQGEAAPLAVSVETAHPAKFPEEIQALLGVDPEVPPSLEGIEERTEAYDNLTTDYAAFKAILQKNYQPA